MCGQVEDLGGQFLLRTADIGTSRATASLKRLQELNSYVTVTAHEAELTGASLDCLKDFSLVVLVDAAWSLVSTVNDYCREHGIMFISTGIFGLFGHVFVDFGPQFQVLDKDGTRVFFR